MGALVDDVFLDPLETIKDHGTGSALDVVDGELADEESNGGGDGIFGEVAEYVGHFGG